MKNFTQVLNIVLLLAVATLFYLHFSSKAPAAALSSNTPANVGGSFRIAYFEDDSLKNHYEYYKEVRGTLQTLEQQKSNELSVLRSAYMAKVKEYQGKGNAMTPAEQQHASQDLAQREKEYQQTEQMKQQEMQDEAVKRLQDVKKTVEDYLKQYNKDKGYSYIFSNTPDLIYYKDTAYNITSDLVKGLNEMHKKKN